MCGFKNMILIPIALELGKAGKRTTYLDIMTEYNKYLKSRLRGGSYMVKGINDHSLQFKYCDIGVDLLLSPYFDTKQQYYQFLERIDKQNLHLYVVDFCYYLNNIFSNRFSCSASKWQVEFVQRYPNIVSTIRTLCTSSYCGYANH